MDFVMQALSAMWFAGCIFGAFAFAYMVYDDGYSPMGGAIVLAICLPLGALLGAFPWMMMADAKDPKIHLNKTEWICMQQHKVPVTTYVMSGKVMVPITTIHTICTQYNKK